LPRNRWLQSCLCVVLLSFSVAAQNLSDPAFSADPQELLQAASNIQQEKPSPATVLLSEHIVEFDSKANQTETVRTVYRVNTAEGVANWSESRTRWEPWHQARPEIKTRVITPDGAVHNLDVKTLTDRPVHEESTIYTDDRVLAGPIPAVTPGAVVEEQITIRDTSPFFAAGITDRVYFVQSVPVVKTRLVLRHPESVHLNYSLKLLPKAVVGKHASGGIEEIVIENGSSDPYEELSNVPADVVLYPQVVFGTGKSWHDIASSYSQLAEPKIAPGALEKSLPPQMPNNASAPDKVRILVAFLHKRVRYTGVEFGEAALIPQVPSETLKRGYGDCKDKSALLVSMLRAAGIPAHLALLQAGPGQDIDADLPGMGEFDHAIVYIPGNPGLWIDATAEHNPMNALPVDDQGRLALIIADDTAALTKTPEAKAEDNLLVENREVHLSEYGPAQITESWEPHGNIEAEYRSYYTPDRNEQRKKELEKYVKSVYLAESLSKLENGDNADLLKPFQMKLEVKRGRRGFTGLEDALVVIQHGYLNDRLPVLLRQEKPADEADKKRSVDYAMTPFVTEWRYRIYPPAGFKVRSLPSNVERKVGPALFKETFVEDSNGIVTAILRFDTVKSRFTAEEAEALRAASVKFRDEDALELSFDHVGHALLARGKIADGLALYQDSVSHSPASALEKTRFADALLTAGLAEKARKVAREAVKLDPNSEPSYSILGWILQHDLIGRHLKSGFDYDGSIAAYKKAIELDPKDFHARTNLAITYEYDKWGIRYTRGARLKEAVEEFRKIRKDDESKFKEYQDNLLYDLFYSGSYQELLNETNGLSMTDSRRHLIIAATAALKGTEAAEKKASELSTDDTARGKSLVAAGRLLLNVRMYERACALLSAGTQGLSDSPVNQQQIAMFSKTRKSEELHIDSSDPTSVVQKLVRAWFTLDANPEDYLALLSKNALEGSQADELKEAKKALPVVRTVVIDSGMLPDVFLDFVLSNMTVTKEGDDQHGYRMALQSPGAPTQHMYVVREGAGYKLLIGTGSEIGREVLDRLSRGDTTSAKAMLDFARDRQQLGGGEDPLAGNVFPRFWTKGQTTDEEGMRVAAVSLLIATDSTGRNISVLEAASQKASEAQRANFDLALAIAYQKLKRWQDMKATAQRLLKSYPRSDRALSTYARACIELKQWDEGQMAINQRLALEPDSLEPYRLLAQLLGAKAEFDKAIEQFRKVATDGRATASDLNGFAWSALFVKSIPPDALEAAQRGNSLTQNNNFGILHTLACLYAEVGKTNEARDLLVRALVSSHLSEPDSALWYGFGRLAELYGQEDAAMADYNRVEKPEQNSAFDTYNLVQNRVSLLTKTHSNIASVAN